jgi:hypothetical protein
MLSAFCSPLSPQRVGKKLNSSAMRRSRDALSAKKLS